MIKRVYVEITNQCNLRCSFCSFHHREFHEMTLEEFECCVQQIKPITDFIYLHIQGEPLLHSRFDEILSICDRYKMKVQLVTNGILIERLMNTDHSSLRKVSFSLHSIEENKVDVQHYMDQIISYIEKYKTKFYIECRFWLKEQMKERSNYCLSRLAEHFDIEMISEESYKLWIRCF